MGLYAPAGLVGREDEFADLETFRQAAARDGGALVLIGEAGIGKTSLLDEVAGAARAAGTRVLRTAGTPSGAGAPFAGLGRLLAPLIERPLEMPPEETLATPEPPVRVLRAALGLPPGPLPPQMVLFTAVLAVVRGRVGPTGIADPEPLLLIVDDTQWLDPATADVFMFVARRLQESGTGLLAVSRPGEGMFTERSRLPIRYVGPLARGPAEQLVGVRFPGLAAEVRNRVVDEAQGNPLALIDLPAGLSPAQATAAEPLPTVLPLTERLQTVFAGRIATLPAGTRELLLLAALEAAADIGLLQSALGHPVPELFPAAEVARIAVIDPGSGRVRFTHPLLRSALLGSTCGDDLRRAHRALAAALPADSLRRAWHLAEAASGPDDGTADLLERSAVRALGRGEAGTAVRMVRRAALLSTRPADRARRLARAAFAEADATGDLRSAARLLDEALSAAPDSAGTLDVVAARILLWLNKGCDVVGAHAELVAALEARADGATDHALAEALWTTAMICCLVGMPQAWDPFHRIVDRHSARLPRWLVLAAAVSAAAGPASPSTWQEIGLTVERLSGAADSTAILRLGHVAAVADPSAEQRTALRRVLQNATETDAFATAVHASALLGESSFLLGDWDDTEQIVDQGLALSETLGSTLHWGFLASVKANVAAVRGDDRTVGELADQMRAWAARCRAGRVDQLAHHALALAALGRADFESAYAHVVQVITPEFPRVPENSLRVVFDLMEALVRTGRDGEADSHAQVLREADEAGPGARMSLVVRGAIAIATRGSSGGEWFESALALPDTHTWPFDRARVQLAYGEYLRRERRLPEARTHLLAAQATFLQLRSGPWVNRASLELRGAGHALPIDPRPVELTPQELRIATLAATGMSNREIAMVMNLSDRTIGGHLYRIFPKLGITSRARLRDAIGSLPDVPADAPPDVPTGAP